MPRRYGDEWWLRGTYGPTFGVDVGSFEKSAHECLLDLPPQPTDIDEEGTGWAQARANT